MKKASGNKTVRQLILQYINDDRGLPLCGSPDDVVEQMGDAMAAVGGDGLLFSWPDLSRRSIAEIEDGLVPALQRRGLMRMRYAFEQFRDNLLDY